MVKKSAIQRVSDAAKSATEMVVAGAQAIVAPASDLPIEMPRNESGADVKRAAKVQTTSVKNATARPQKKLPAVRPRRAKKKAPKKAAAPRKPAVGKKSKKKKPRR